MKNSNKNNQKNSSKDKNHDEIKFKAEKLALGRMNLRKILNITEKEIRGSASLALLLALHGKNKDARILLDGLKALEPKCGYLHSIEAQMEFIRNNKENCRNILTVSREFKNIDNTMRLKRAEMLRRLQHPTAMQLELEFINENKLTPDLHKTLQTLQKAAEK
ncbi:MAG: hypothetical protein PF689_11930 [Deltaproteobacteria bacterium]|jgi:predicted Zn-dependent protease|nr:hypothetical protein [Deltaproteobacteria bacterium]